MLGGGGYWEKKENRKCVCIKYMDEQRKHGNMVEVCMGREEGGKEKDVRDSR